MHETKAPEDWRIPRRFAVTGARMIRQSAAVLCRFSPNLSSEENRFWIERVASLLKNKVAA